MTSNIVPSVLIFSTLGFFGWQGLQYSSPEFVNMATLTGNLMTGNLCAPNSVIDDIYMPVDVECNPVAEMVSAPKIENVEANDTSGRDTVLTMINPSVLGRYRQVIFQRDYDPKSLRESGLIRSDAAATGYEFANGWLTTQGEEACAMLPKDFASSCQVLSMTPRTDLTLKGETLAVTFNLTYTAAQLIGPVSTVAEKRYLHGAHLEFKITHSETVPLAKRVELATSQAVKSCQILRDKVGNCMVSQLTIDPTGEVSINLNAIDRSSARDEDWSAAVFK